LYFEDSLVTDNETLGRGGGIFNDGVLSLVSTTVSHNRTSGGLLGVDAQGAGIYNAGLVSITRSAVTQNGAGVLKAGVNVSQRFAFGGGIFNAGTLILENSTVGRNGAGSLGMAAVFTTVGRRR
jgi:hypothetical protein